MYQGMTIIILWQYLVHARPELNLLYGFNRMSYQRHVNFLYMFNKDIPIHKQQLYLKNIKKINEGRIFFFRKIGKES